MVEKGRSGAYIPVGMMHRSQLDATSPWLWMERKSEEACPDCLYERKNWPLTAAGRNERLSDGMIISRNLPRAVRAVVIENAGNLEKVVVNPRQGLHTSSAVRKLSGNLAKVSQAVSKLETVKEQNRVFSPRTHHDRSRNLVLDMQPQLKEVAARTVPELLSYMDQMAREMHLDLGSPLPPPAAVERNSRKTRQSLLLSEDAEPLLTPWPANCVELEKDYWTARKQAQPAPDTRSTPPSVYTTAPTSRKPSLQPTTVTTEPQKHDLPSTILRATDISPTPTTPLIIPPTTHPTASPSPYPVTMKPALRKSPRPPQKRVRVMDIWPPGRDREVPPLENDKKREQEQLARNDMRLDRAKVAQEAAEMERVMRRRIRTRGGLVGGK